MNKVEQLELYLRRAATDLTNSSLVFVNLADYLNGKQVPLIDGAKSYGKSDDDKLFELAAKIKELLGEDTRKNDKITKDWLR